MSTSAQDLNLNTIARILWAAALLTLPVTSFRYFPAGDATYVRPLSFYPLALLMPVLLIQFLNDKRAFPRAGVLTPLTAFLFIALAASLLGVLFAPVALRGQDGLVYSHAVLIIVSGHLEPVEIGDVTCNSAQGLVGGLIVFGHRLHGNSFYGWQILVDLAGQYGPVDSVIGGIENVTGPVMAIHAVHLTRRGSGNLFF